MITDAKIVIFVYFRSPVRDILWLIGRFSFFGGGWSVIGSLSWPIIGSFFMAMFLLELGRLCFHWQTIPPIGRR